MKIRNESLTQIRRVYIAHHRPHIQHCIHCITAPFSRKILLPTKYTSLGYSGSSTRKNKGMARSTGCAQVMIILFLQLRLNLFWWSYGANKFIHLSTTTGILVHTISSYRATTTRSHPGGENISHRRVTNPNSKWYLRADLRLFCQKWQRSKRVDICMHEFCYV